MKFPGESEKQFAGEVVRLCKARHKRVYFTLHSKGSPEGWPDLVILDPPWMYIRELKTDTGRLTPAQTDTLDALKRCLYIDVGIWRPQDWNVIVRLLSGVG